MRITCCEASRGRAVEGVRSRLCNPWQCVAAMDSLVSVHFSECVHVATCNVCSCVTIVMYCS